jgi:dihydrofolate synthase/folylpolyglutamate synthase
MDAIDYLFSLETLGIKFGLDSIRAILEALGHPQRAYRRVIVAGTNGKGSVTAMADTALRAAGHRTARYTSPHLRRLEERFAIDGREVETAALRESAEAVRGAVADLIRTGRLAGQPTFFEATTAAAFELFRRAGVEVAVVEVGLGGRLDATNAEASFAAAITSIDLDHEALLGSSLPAIAREKAGVVHEGMTVVLGDPQPEVRAVVAEVCRARGARLVETGAAGVRGELHEGRARLEIRTARRGYGPVRLGLRGRHQIPNAVTAAVLLEELDALGVAAPPDAVEAGLAGARWPGRLEVLRHLGTSVLLDAAHNPAGARALAAYLAETHPGGLPIVFGAMRDKDVPGMLAALAPVATRFTLTRARTPRACPPARLDEAASEAAPAVPREVVEDLEEAVTRARARAPFVCVAGSIFLVGDVRGWLIDRGADAEA